uniref:Uncharacterized protein n=1 Tax=Bionectria ochroleuca TaxID=29856 RepID=A0A8H7MYD4_BIOOC
MAAFVITGKGVATAPRAGRAPSSSRVTRLSDPHAGTTVLIIDAEHNRALACHDGDLRLEKVPGDLDSLESIPVHWQWFSTETDGFKGFRSVANGGFLGHDIWWGFYARVHHHLGWEHATLSRRPGGCYWIQFEHWWTLRQLCARGDGGGVYWQQEGARCGSLWRCTGRGIEDGTAWKEKEKNENSARTCILSPSKLPVTMPQSRGMERR